MTFCGFGQTAISGMAASLQQERRSAAEMRQAGNDPVSVIIALRSDAVLDGNESASYLETSDAAAESDAVLRTQDAVIAQIREWYPELEVRYRYSTLINGFSCSLPANLIAKVSELPEVESISKSGQIKVKKELASAATLGNIPYFHNETGCTGEGQVIAVIDSELDVTHPMFAPLADDIQTKIDMSDLEAIASGIGFNTQFDPETAYYGTKVPFAIDYTEDPFQIADPVDYHGTHVCGIAAGNRVTDEEGVAMSGVAPDAQIVFMGMQHAMFDIEEVLIAAIEDAVKLDVDAINMSLGVDGDPMGQSALAEAVNQAEAAGITVCIAAGNSDNGSVEYNEKHYSDNPDVSWMNSFISEGTNALAVASADNPSIANYHCFSFNGQQIPYEGSMETDSDDMRYLSNELDLNQDYEYVYCGFGRAEDFSKDVNLYGKIALIDRGENYFSDKALNARSYGAVAAIIVQNDDSDPLIMASDDPLPIGMISKQNGDLLKNAENKTIRFTDSLLTVQRSTGVSAYSSWGIHSSLELRPDIMAIGGNVTSAAYGGTFQNLSGTSMATPYMAGCSAILKQYLLKNGCTLTGPELARYMRNLLMTTAVPYRANKMFVTPRRQGAGLVQMDAAIRNKVILTGAEGESKLSLRDKLGTQFSFPLTLTNISSEDVSFTDARIELTTDDSEFDENTGRYLINGQQPLSCSASLNSLKQIAAGESRTETVTVSLDAAQYADLKKIFTSGFFIEGYLVLTGAENNTDISIPLVGFSDNFAQIPAFTDNIRALAQIYDRSATDTSIPLCESVQLLTQALNHAPFIDTGDPYSIWQTALEYASEDELAKLNRKPDAIYCSPNNDGYADIVALHAEVQRHCFLNGMDLLDQNGKIISKGQRNQILSKAPDFNTMELLANDLFNNLAEGEYTARIYASISEDPAEEDIQRIEYPLYIDKTKPVLKTGKKTGNGRTTVSVTASDECALDGVIVLCSGDGHVVGQDDPFGKLPTFTSLNLAQAHVALAPYYLFNGTIAEKYNLNDDPPIDTDQLHPLMQYLADINTSESAMLLEDYEYAVFIPTDGSSKELTFEYDVTDLSNYQFLAIDRAFNFCDQTEANDLAKPNAIKQGVYQSSAGLFIFTEDTLHFIPEMESYETTYHYTISNGSLTLIGDLDDSNERGEFDLRASFRTNGSLQIRGVFDYLLGTSFDGDPYNQMLQPVDIKDPEHYFAIHGYEAEKRYIDPYVLSIAEGVHIGQTDYEFLPDGVVIFNINCFRSNTFAGSVSVRMDLKTGIGILADGTTIDFLHKVSGKTGDVSCDGTVDVADAVMLARLLAEDRDVQISGQGKINADADRDSNLTTNDVVTILRAIARLITLD